ncbi:hypothetical protein NYE59_01720 [Paenibacillus sp. FSL L8-0323]|uniref:hypothetical protein n=1 Tax=Paenibacillus sp. FSL L8-0323 TaxID=2975330 RepID=UPI0030F979BB
MSAFDEERKKLGLLTSNKNSTTSAFDNDRMDLGLIKDTRTKTEVKKTETKKEIPKTQAEANVNTKVSDTLKGKVPAASLITTPNSFGNNAVTEFSDKVPAASLLTAGTGGPSAKQSNSSSIKNAVENFNAFTDRAKSAATFGGTELVDKLFTKIGPEESKQAQKEANERAKNVKGGIVADVIGSLMPGELTYRAGEALVKPLVKNSPEIVQAITRGAAAGALFQTGNELGQMANGEQQSLAGRAKDIGFSTLVGGAADGVLTGVGQGISKLVGKSATKAEPNVARTLTREQEVYAKNIEDLTPDDIEFMVKTEAKQPKQVEPTYVKPDVVTPPVVSSDTRGAYQRLLDATTEPNASRQVAASAEPTFAEFPAQPVSKAAEAPIPTKSLVDPVVTPKQVVKPKETLSVEPVTEVKAPVVTQRGFTETLKASEKTPSQVKANLNNEYTPITNLETVQKANSRLKADADAETSRVLSAKKFDAEDSVVAQRLIDHYNKQGNYEMSVTIADKVAEEATKAGQFIQSLSIYDRLTPEGVLIRAKRIEKRVNETASKIGKAAKVTDDMAKDIVDLAGVTQKMTGVKDLSNNVIDILERAKKGETLTSNEASQLERFVKESKQFIKETTKTQKSPKSPTTIKDKRVRDNVTSFLDAQEQAAKARLKAKGIRISSTPLDVWADYAVIGAAKMGKNIVKFADWSEQMVKDLGEDIRPHLNQLYESSKEAFNLTSKKISRQTISEAERLTQKVIKEKELSVPEAESLLKIAQRVSSLSGEAKRTASQDLQAILQSLDKPSFLRKVASAQTQAQLLNPKTQVRNVLGNELFYRLERLNKYVATPIDIARSVLTGADRTVTFRSNNQGQYWYNFINGAKAGWKGVNINGLETQFDLASPAFTGKYNPLKYTEKALGASLRSFDNAAYSRAVNKSLGELGTLDAINKGVKPTKEYIKNYIAQADENIIQIADHYGKYVTFQDNNIISKGLTGLKKGLNVGKDFGFGDLVLKYPKTPGALLMRALEYSPAGFLRSAKIVAEPLLRNGIQKNPAEATQALSRAIIGTFGLSGLGYFLIDNDILTGQANKDRDIRSLQTAAGQGQYQVNLSALYRFVSNNFDPTQAKIKEGDLLYNYDWMQPVSVAVSMGANINKNLGEGKDTTTGVLSSAYNSISGGLNTLTEQSVLQGLARAAEGYPGQTVTDKIADILSDIPASFVPTILNQVKQATDNTKRETTDQTLLEQTLNKAQAKIPGLAGKLPKKYDTLGNEQNHYQDNNAVNVFLNPGFPSRYKLSDEARMIVDLITETGDEGIAPRVPNKKLDGSKLTGEQFSRLSKLQGDETKERLGKVKESLSTKSKVKKIKGQLTKSTAEAKKQLSKEFPELKVSK